MSNSNDDRYGPKLTSGPSLPIHGPQARQPFGRGTHPGRDPAGAGAKSKDDPSNNPSSKVFRSPYGGGQGEESSASSSFAPAISLPTGGGALRSIGEKFSPNPFTGGGSMSVPIATSPGRGGFGPQLGLSYSSGSGNGPFGLGWMLGVPAISRKTEKGLPQYRDTHPELAQHDTFILAGVEDLVHLLDAQGQVWEQVRDGHVIHRFVPRVEGGFARIERWRSQSTGVVHWRTISPGNVTSIFGQSADARIADPSSAARVFSWLLEQSFDDRGNIIVYEYAREDLEGANRRAPEEAPRLAKTELQAQRYLKRIKYGNQTPFVAGDWLFEVVLDYGEHGEAQGEQLDISPDAVRPWPARRDTFSTCRAGFELRTRRLCRRVLMFHRFAELGVDPYLVASTDFEHDEQPELTRLVGVTQRRYRKDAQTGFYEVASLPQLEFDYSEAKVDRKLHVVKDPATLRNLPAGIDGRQYRLVDLDGEGLPGIVIESAGAWHYKRGLGDGRFGPMVALPSRPINLGAAGTQLMDIDGDGQKELVSFVRPMAGFFKRTQAARWSKFRALRAVPNIDWQDPRLQLVDLTGDGFPDVLLDRGDRLIWYRSKREQGFEAPRTVPKAAGGVEQQKPVLMHADARTSIQLADMTGDGLADLVRVRDGQVVYWQNLGYGRFGPMIRMRVISRFSSSSGAPFDPQRLRLADVDGSGAVDLIYLGERSATLFRNQAGNAFAPGEELRSFPGYRSVDWAEVVDLKGTGTAQLVWSTALSSGRGGRLRYIDLMSGQKPHLLVGSRNNMGAETKVAYAPSTKFYLADKAKGKPWVSKLPFPVQVVTRVESIDHVTRQRAVQHFAYHHGYFDGVEREFRGFGLVESWDTESFEDFNGGEGLFSFEQFDAVEEQLHQPPVYTRSWFHTGVLMAAGKRSRLYADQYWQGDASAFELPDAVLPGNTREAARALAGRTLRTEVYALDGTLDAGKPYAVSEASFSVRQVQGRGPNAYGVYFAYEREALSYHYERNVDDPRVAHQFVLEVDGYGTPLRSASVVYPRRVPAYSEQGDYGPGESAVQVTLSESEVVHLDGLDDALRLAVPTQARSYELCGLTRASATAFSLGEMLAAADAAVAIDYETPPSGPGVIEKRLLSGSKTRYMADDLSGPLPHGSVQSKALAYDSDAMAMTDAQRQAVFGGRTGTPTDAELLDEGKYVLTDGAWWVRTGHPSYDASQFYAVTGVVDPYGNAYATAYDAYALLVTSSTDALGHTVSVAHDYRLLAPWQVTDANGNRSQVSFDVLGLVEKTAVMGKVGDADGDTLDDPTSTFEYDLFAWQTAGKPNWAKTRVRETHQDANTRWLEQRSYFSGAGAVVMVKAQARPGLAPQRDEDGQLVLDQDGEVVLADTSPNLRWVGNGRVVRDNKGNVVKAYEPYFSSTPEYEDEAELVEQGVTPLHHYDPLGRLVRTDLPNGTFSTVTFTPWTQVTHDVNDTVTESSWYAERENVGAEEQRAAQLAAAHAHTPTVVHLDVLGRPFLSIAHNKDLQDADEYFVTKSLLDIQGNVLEVIDARGNIAEARTYGMLGQSLEVRSHDAGDRWRLLTALGEPMRTWDSRGQRFSYTYDALRRPVDRLVSVAGGPPTLLGRIVYGEQLASPQATNHIGRVYRVYDGAGVATTPAFDFEGHPTSEQRHLLASKTTEADWSPLLGQATIAQMATAAAPLLDAETFEASAQHDALGRVLVAISPDQSQVHYSYDEAGNLQAVDLHHRGSNTPTPTVGDITYNARGQRLSVVHGPANSPTTTTSYTYDPQTYRLTRLHTRRHADNAALQDLSYHYDPAGNITDIRDGAQQTVYFQNAVVEPANSYTYDALYRLIEATGREHSSQGTTQRTHAQQPIGPQPMTSDPSAMRRYTQRYTYDAVGNVLKMQHLPAVGAGWTRHYVYDIDGNRLLETSAPGDPQNGPYTHAYTYDAHGSMTAMPHIAAMTWGHGDELQQALVGTQTVTFQYAGGQRSRKYVETAGSTTTEERIYLGPFELYRKRVNGSLTLERETLHISDGSGRICMVETKTVDGGSPVQDPAGIWRYQHGNHLGSTALEVDGDGAIISYEEYHPYGTSAYRAVDASIDVSARRYRYTGMERDEETGLAYHTARYYAPWLGRWTACDPVGLNAGPNRYGYVKGGPTRSSDRSGLVERPSQAEMDAYINEANEHNARVETYLAQRRTFDANAEHAQQRWARLEHERSALLIQEHALWDWFSSISSRNQAAALEENSTREYEEGAPEAWAVSGRTMTRLQGGTNLFLGAGIAAGGGPGGMVIGGDFLQAGLREVVTGDRADTILRSGAELASEALGSSPQVAQIHGDMAETLVPVLLGAVQLSRGILNQPPSQRIRFAKSVRRSPPSASDASNPAATEGNNGASQGGAIRPGVQNDHAHGHGFSARNVNEVGGTTNCAECAIAFDSLLAGNPAQAGASGITTVRSVERHFGQRFARGLTANNIGYEIGAAGPGSRGIVFGYRGQGKIGHFFNVVNQRGVVRFIDPQTGTAANLSGYKNFWILRTN